MSDRTQRDPRRQTGLGLVAAVLLAALLSALAPAAAEVDPFYLDRLQDGDAALDRQDWVQAERALRLACFGLLEQPVQLGGCLVRLAVAQGNAGQREELLRTVRRLAEVEERFGGYRDAEVPEEIAVLFPRVLVSLLNADELSSLAPFAHLVEARVDAELRRLPPRRLRAEIEAGIAAEPSEPRWPLLLAELELAEENPRQAAEAADRVLAIRSAESRHRDRASCLKGQALADQESCAAALPLLATCTAPERHAQPAAALLACQLATGRTAAARALAAALSAEVRTDRRVAPLLDRLPPAGDDATGAGTTGGDAGAASGSSGATAGDEPQPTAGARAVDARAVDARAVDARAREQLVDLRRRMATGGDYADLVALHAEAAALADRHPGWIDAQYLAGESAYRASRWEEAVRYFDRGGEPDEAEPLILFYMAVSHYESGRRERAAELMRRCLPRLSASPLVEQYRDKILVSDDG